LIDCLRNAGVSSARWPRAVVAAPRELCERTWDVLLESVSLILLPSRGLQASHAPEVQRQAHELELGLHAVQSSQAELPEPEHALDPAVGRLGDPFASALGRPALGCLQLRSHARRVRTVLGVDLCAALAFAPHGHHRGDA